MIKILIVEDYESIKDLYQKAFKEAGFEVETAGSGAEAARIVGEEEFDLIVLDMLMLEMSGLDFLRQFAVAKAATKTKVLVVSNLDSPNIMKQAIELGADRYLLKSHYTPQQIVDEAVDVLKTATKA